MPFRVSEILLSIQYFESIILIVYFGVRMKDDLHLWPLEVELANEEV